MKSDVQSDSLALPTSFTTRVLQETALLTLNSSRDLTVDRTEYLPALIAVSEAQAKAAYEAYLMEAKELDIPYLTEDEFIEQLLGVRGGDFFRSVVNSTGLETSYEEELITEAGFSVPYQGDRGSFLLSERILDTLTHPPVVATIQADSILSKTAGTTSSALHLTESEPALVADLDPSIYSNTLRALSYVQTYLS